MDYFELRDAGCAEATARFDRGRLRESLRLETVLFDTGIASDEAVAQAETQLETAEAQDTELGIARAQFEHAIALLVGQPASTFSIAPEPLKASPRGRFLSECRRSFSSAARTSPRPNEAWPRPTPKSAWPKRPIYPTVTLAASAGLESTSITDWFTWPSRVWSVGPSRCRNAFLMRGLRRATVQQFQAQYDETVANYRQTVLTAFQQVEDNLSALRILSQEIQQQDTAVKSAETKLVPGDRPLPPGNRPLPQRDYCANHLADQPANGREPSLAADDRQRAADRGSWAAAGIVSQLPSPAAIVEQCSASAANAQAAEGDSP